jgi:hypothetical protein
MHESSIEMEEKYIRYIHKLLSAEGLGVRVHAEKDVLVDERILLLRPWASEPWNLRGGQQIGLMKRVTSGLEILVVGRLYTILGRAMRHHIRGAQVALVRGGFVEGAKYLIKEAESALYAVDEATSVSTRSELEKV